MTGTTFTRCGCRDEHGRQLGAGCPQLTERGHGVRWISTQVPTAGGTVRFRRAVGPASEAKRNATAMLSDIEALLRLGTDTTTRAKIGGLIVATRTGPLPAHDDVRRRLGLGGELTGSMSTGELFDAWFTAKRRWRESTRRGHAEKMRLWITPVIGDIPAERLNAAHVDAVLSAIRERNAAIELGEVKGRPLSLQTQRHVHATMRACLRWAVRNRHIVHDPSAGVELEAVPTRDVVVYGPEQIGAYLRHAAEDRYAVAWRLVLLLGLRRGEVIGLRWAGVNLDGAHPSIRITDTVLQLGGRVVAGKPKTSAGERFVSLDAGTAEALRSHRARQAVEKLAWGAAYTDSDLVFAKEDGTGLRPDWVSRQFQRLARAAGLPVIRLHDGRHSAASLGLASGEDIKTISKMLGHSTTAITQDLYTHVTPVVASDSVSRMARLIDLPQPGHTSGTHRAGSE